MVPAIPAAESEGTISDADLELLVESWKGLPDAIRVGIMAMVRTAGTIQENK